MEFWGIEVKPGKPVHCDPEENEMKYIHLSQASFGEVKDDNEKAVIYITCEDKKFALATLTAGASPQCSFDLVFDKPFELTHTSKNASVYFLGYRTYIGSEAEGEYSDFSESESDSDSDLKANDLSAKAANGKLTIKNEGAKASTGKVPAAKADDSAAKSKSKINEQPKKDEKMKVDQDDEDDSDEDDSDEGSDEDDSGEDEDMAEGEDDSDAEEDSSDEEEATPKKVEVGKKRAAESASKTPEKKAKVVTPAGQKTGGDGKKSGHTATPHPSKQASKTPGNTDKGKQKTPQSGGGAFSCKQCNKPFNSDTAVQAHTKAKHGK